MTAKEYLEQAVYLERLIKNKHEQYLRLRELLTKVSPTLVRDKVKESRVENKREAMMSAYVDLSNELDMQMSRLLKTQREIKNMIAKLPDLRCRLILEYRYLLNLEWRVIADRMGYSERQLTRYHGRALAIFEKMSEDVRKCP